MLAAEASRAADPAITAQALSTTARCLALIERDMPRAMQLANEANQIARANRLELHEVQWALGMMFHFGGELERAEAELQDGDSHQQDARRSLLRVRVPERAGLHRAGAAPLPRRESGRRAPSRWCKRIGEGSEGRFAAALDALARYGVGEADSDQVDAGA